VSKFDLSLVMAERQEGLLVHFEYNSDLFDRSSIERLTRHFETLLLAIVSDGLNDTHESIATLPMLTASERQRILYDWNATSADYADDACIHELIEQRAAERPLAPAVLFQDSVVSFGELNERANRIAHYLVSHGAGPGSIVGLCVERSPDLVAGLLGIFKSGAAYVPLDPKYPQERLDWMLTDSAASLVLTQSHLLGNLPPHAARDICLDTDWADISEHRLRASPVTRVRALLPAGWVVTVGAEMLRHLRLQRGFEHVLGLPANSPPGPTSSTPSRWARSTSSAASCLSSGDLTAGCSVAPATACPFRRPLKSGSATQTNKQIHTISECHPDGRRASIQGVTVRSCVR
jgi:hypothetical protein